MAGGAAGRRERLTARQAEIADLVARGLTNDEIANRLGIGEKTVRTHVTDILARLGIDTGDRHVRLARWAMARDGRTVVAPWRDGR